jgi:hypothetical protein
MDMLRFQKFTIGWNWVADYGSSDTPDGFRYLKAYSPLHNLKDGTAYPATLVTTADHDDRVVPAHSFKFAARLQQAHRGANPVLIRIETASGHGSSSLTKSLAIAADEYAFTMTHLKMAPIFPPAITPYVAAPRGRTEMTTRAPRTPERPRCVSRARRGAQALAGASAPRHRFHVLSSSLPHSLRLQNSCVRYAA